MVFNVSDMKKNPRVVGVITHNSYMGKQTTLVKLPHSLRSKRFLLSPPYFLCFFALFQFPHVHSAIKAQNHNGNFFYAG